MNTLYQNYTGNKIQKLLADSTSIKFRYQYLLKTVKNNNFKEKIYHLFETHCDLILDLKDIGSIYNIGFQNSSWDLVNLVKNLFYKLKTKIAFNRDMLLVNDLIINEYSFISQLNSLIANCAIPKSIRERLEKYRTKIYTTTYLIEGEVIDSIIQTENLIITE